MKGMTVTGTMRGPRIKSLSPNKSTAPSTPRSHNSGTATPHARSETSNDANDERRKTTDFIATPRTLSDTSNMSKDLQERPKTMSDSSTALIVDTRSKTISSVNQNHPPTGAEVMDIMANHGKKNTPSLLSVPNSGYGKPLVTSFNKKLVIRRELPCEQTSPAIGNKVNSRIKSTTKYPIKSWKAENGQSKSPERNLSRDVLLKDKQPTKGNKMRSSITNPNVRPDVKKGMLKHNAVAKPYSSSSSITKSLPNRSPTRFVKSVDSKPQDKLKPIKTDFNRDMKKNHSEPRRSPTRTLNRMKPGLVTLKTPLEPERKSSAPLRDMLNEKIKLPFFNDSPTSHNTSVMGRQSSQIHSNRSYKPQLEDIKSSYLLLSNNSINQNIGDMNGMQHVPISIRSMPKPRPLNENIRKEQLNEIKKKFQSRQFRNDAKYDKIEGLNWITWK